MPGRRSGSQGSGRAVYDGATRILSAAMIVLGVLLLWRGSVLGIGLGVAMILAGAGRMWVVAQRRPRR